MTPLAISAIACACIILGTLIGMFLASALPKQHLSAESKDAIRLAMGMIATVTALVLGLVTASAKSEYDDQDAAVKHSASAILTLDRMLARYGTETQEIRELLRNALIFRLDITWPENGSQPVKIDTSDRTPILEQLENKIRHLSPMTEDQRWFQSHALEITNDLLQTRWIMFGGKGSSIPLPFLLVMVFWLTVLFASFGLFAPRNATVFAVLFVCAVSVSASLFLILEMDQPFEGLMRISSEPLRYTLSQLGK